MRGWKGKEVRKFKKDHPKMYDNLQTFCEKAKEHLNRFDVDLPKDVKEKDKGDNPGKDDGRDNNGRDKDQDRNTGDDTDNDTDTGADTERDRPNDGKQKKD